MAKPKLIRLTFQQRLDIELANATGDPDGLDADSAAYVCWQLMRGPIPDGQLLARTCKNGACVNPDHLILLPGE